MILPVAVWKACQQSLDTGKVLYVIRAGTWRICDKCELDTKYPDARVVYVADRGTA